jgi:hypothetical protein
MYTKLIALATGFALAVVGLASSATAAASSCPEARTACQPVGERPDAQTRKPRAPAKLTTPTLDSSGQVWRAGNRIMW